MAYPTPPAPGPFASLRQVSVKPQAITVLAHEQHPNPLARRFGVTNNQVLHQRAVQAESLAGPPGVSLDDFTRDKSVKNKAQLIASLPKDTDKLRGPITRLAQTVFAIA